MNLARAIEAQHKWDKAPIHDAQIIPLSPRIGRPRREKFTDHMYGQALLWFVCGQIMGKGMSWAAIARHFDDPDGTAFRRRALRRMNAIQTGTLESTPTLGVLSIAQRDDLVKLWVLRSMFVRQVGWAGILDTVYAKTGALVADPCRLSEFVKEHAKRKGYTIQRARR